jgi:hypothetical protein
VRADVQPLDTALAAGGEFQGDCLDGTVVGFVSHPIILPWQMIS